MEHNFFLMSNCKLIKKRKGATSSTQEVYKRDT
jgi:hypothetical protein